MIRILLVLNTLRFLRPTQILNRLIFDCKKHFLRPVIAFGLKSKQYHGTPTHLFLHPKCFATSAIQNLGDKRFKFLNVSKSYKNAIAWNDPLQSKLWLYNLHYFEYLLPLLQEVSDQNFVQAEEIIMDWLQHNPVGQGNGWEPYPISLRVVNWIFFYNAYFDYFQKEGTFRKTFLNSLYQQVAYLNLFLEKHLLANHLWANARTLLFAGLFFNERKWIERGFQLVSQELNEQILPDGGHYECSPMYHAIILLDAIDLLNLIKALNNSQSDLPEDILKLQEKLSAKAKTMWRWLRAVTQPDGAIPLLGDSALEMVPRTEHIGRYLAAVLGESIDLHPAGPKISLPHSGYFVFRDAQRFLIIDGGELGVRYQPGHAHCDFLSYELSYKGLRFIVDSGVGEYLPTSLRQKARSIQSHNTLVINGLEQAELWAAFRMGRRIRPQEIHCDTEPAFQFRASYFNGLKKGKEYWHQRIIRLNEALEVTDLFEARRLESVENLLHLHPDCLIRLEEGRVMVRRAEVGIAIMYDAQTVLATLRDWFYVPEFGKVLPSPVVVLQPKGSKISEMKYRIVFL